MSKQELHLVFGGALADPRENVLSDPNDVDVVGIYPSYEAALDALAVEKPGECGRCLCALFRGAGAQAAGPGIPTPEPTNAI